jgi:hypothetical protein
MILSNPATEAHMKDPGFTFDKTFPVIASAILHSPHSGEGFVSHKEIVAWLLDNDCGRTLVEDALKHRPLGKSPKGEAGVMVAWFSQTWTMTKGKHSVWDGLFENFERRRSGGRYCYRPRGGLRDLEIMQEGARVRVFANQYERDPRARAICIEKYGTDCCICDFSFRKAYGEEADGIVYVHHLRPLAEVGEEHEVDPINDLRPVCPNCHAVLHWRIPAYSIEEVKELLSNAKI